MQGVFLGAHGSWRALGHAPEQWQARMTLGDGCIHKAQGKWTRVQGAGQMASQLGGSDPASFLLHGHRRML